MILNGWYLWLVAFLAMVGAFSIVNLLFQSLSQRFDFWALLTRLKWFS